MARTVCEDEGKSKDKYEGAGRRSVIMGAGMHFMRLRRKETTRRTISMHIIEEMKTKRNSSYEKTLK